MLRRHSKQSKPDLRHRKSTSSARSVILAHLDPTVAQRDAQVAAHQAFARAQDRSSAEMPLFPPQPSSTRHTTSRDGLSQKENGAGVLGGPSIPRRQSVRFVGPCTVQEKDQLGKGQRARASTVQGPVDPAEYANTAETSTLTLHAPQPRPGTSLSTTSSAVVGGYIQALIAGDEVYTPEDDIASVPSSYRRLRRSQSMFPHGKGGLVRHSEEIDVPTSDQNASAVPETPATPRPATASEAKENIRPPQAPALRAPRSMSFLRGRHGRNSSINSYESGGTAVSTSFRKAPLRSKPSAFFGGKGRQGQSSLGRTLRTSSSNAELAPHPSRSPVVVPKHGGLRNKARKASKSLKDRLKHLFSSSKGDGDTVLPDQHVKSQKNHNVTDGFHSFDQAPDTNSQYDVDNGTSNTVPNQQDARFCLPNQVDEDQAGEDKSRVTSWTNSGPSTLTSEQQHAWREWEKQRLSIIKENGAHCPSPSLQRPAIGQHILQSQESLLGQPIPPGPTVDSQRMYAALMQRLNETTQLAHIVEQQRHNIAERSEASLLISKADFEDYQDNGAKPAPLMVRRVTSRGSSTVPYSDLHGADDALNAVASSRLQSGGIRPPVSLSPSTEVYGGPESPGRVVSDRASAFFGSPDSHLFRVESPYRRALRRSMEEAEGELRQDYFAGARVISDCGTEIRRPQDVDEYEYSESIYSCDEDRVLNPLRDAMTPIVESPNNASTLRDASVRKEATSVTYRPSTSDRIDSSVSSVDWKAWLSANVAKLQPSPSPTRHSKIVYAVPSIPESLGRGHVRESAQTGSDQGTPPAMPSTHRQTLAAPPLTPTPTGPDKLKSFPFGKRSSLLKRAPRAEGSAQVEGSRVDRPVSPLEPLPFPDFGPAPPVPPRSPLRTSPYTPSLSNARSMSHLREEDASVTKPPQEAPSLAHARSVNQLAYAANTNLGSPRTPATRSRGLKLQKKRSGFLYSPSVANSSPGLTAAVEKQFGPASRLPSKLGEGKENILTPAAKLFTPDAEMRSARSKMVDVFLSSRRKRMASGSNGTAAHDESAAFI